MVTAAVRPARQEMIEMPAPLRRVFVRPPFARLGETKDHLDPQPEFRGGFRRAFPDRLQDPQDGLCVDPVDWLPARATKPAAQAPAIAAAAVRLATAMTSRR